MTIASLVQLRDGSAVHVRPVEAADKPLLEAGFERFGESSRYRRFMGHKKRLTPAELAFLTEVDHRDHEAVAALDAGTGEGVGVARYLREDERTAEAAVAVVDEWQGRGVGGLLLRRLVESARANGVTRFTASMLTDNRDMLHLFERVGTVRRTRADGGTWEIEVELPVDGLEETLRAAARQEVCC